jgi:hypothetical protein
MKISLALLVVIGGLVSGGAAAQAQALDFAWFAGVGGGLAAHDNGPFSRRLQSYYNFEGVGAEQLYQTQDFPRTSYTLNAGGGLMFGGSILIGLNGEKLFLPAVMSTTGIGNRQDEYRLSGVGGGIDLGYVLVNDAGTLVYPFIHAGYYSYTLEIDNQQPDSLPFFEGKPIPPATMATYTGAAPRFGIGVGLVRYLGGISGGAGGLVVNARLSYGRMPSRPEWEQDGKVVSNGGHTPEYNAVSLSVSIGGGTGR